LRQLNLVLSKAELKNLTALKAKKGRRAQKRFQVGGVRVLEEALKFQFQPVKLLYSQADISNRGRNLVAQFQKRGVMVVGVSNRELGVVSDTESTQGIIGIFNVPETNLPKLYKPSFRRLLLCDRINDPGNLGTLIRSALAFGFNAMLVTDNSVELFSPKVVRSSAGAIFGLPVVNVSYRELKEFKSSHLAKMAVALSPKDVDSISMKHITPTVEERYTLILAIGSEAEGLSQEILSMADFKVNITHSSNVESLNAAVAGSILMYELFEKARNEAK